MYDIKGVKNLCLHGQIKRYTQGEHGSPWSIQLRGSQVSLRKQRLHHGPSLTNLVLSVTYQSPLNIGNFN